MKRKDYTKPEVAVVNLKMSGMLMVSGDTRNAETLNNGQLNARGSSSFWDDDDNE